ncbi:hypothetical protein D3C71_1038340 [compost metagenome]
MREAAHMREAIWVERMDVERSHARRMRLVAPLLVVQCKHLHTTAAIALDAMAGTAHDEQLLGIGRAVAHHVHGQVFTIAALQGVGM